MTKVKVTSFKKGQVANPNGRPTGSYSRLRKQLMELRKLAADDVLDMYKSLKEAAITHKESWAYQIYFKELVSVPKDWLNEVDTSDIPKKLEDINGVNTALALLSSKLLSQDTMSTDEIHNVIKTLNAIKFTEQFGKQKENLLEKLSDDQIKQLMSWIEEVRYN